MSDHRRRRNAKIRGAFDAARERGLAARHRAKRARGDRTHYTCRRCGEQLPASALLDHLALHRSEEETLMSPQRVSAMSWRHKGGKQPGNVVNVARRPHGTGKWGNPHPVGKPCEYCHGQTHTQAEAVERFRQYLADHPELVATARTELRGYDLACFCKPDQDCHADVLLSIVNTEENA